jgi:hypothetical protein
MSQDLLKKNCIAIRAMLKEMSCQASWGPLGDNRQIGPELTKTVKIYGEKGVYDAFYTGEFHDGKRDEICVKMDLLEEKKADFENFVKDFSTILLKYVHIQEIRWYIKFSKDYCKDPIITSDNEDHICSVLRGLMEDPYFE